MLPVPIRYRLPLKLRYHDVDQAGGTEKSVVGLRALLVALPDFRQYPAAPGLEALPP